MRKSTLANYKAFAPLHQLRSVGAMGILRQRPLGPTDYYGWDWSLRFLFQMEKDHRIDWYLASCSLEQGLSEFGLLGERKLLPAVNETIDNENERQPLVLRPPVSFSADFGEHPHRIEVGPVLVREPSICSPLT